MNTRLTIYTKPSYEARNDDLAIKPFMFSTTLEAKLFYTLFRAGYTGNADLIFVLEEWSPVMDEWVRVKRGTIWD